MHARPSRRQLMRLAAAGLASATAGGWLEALAEDTARDPRRKRSCILLWMSGGPSQIDTFDPKPDHPNGGQTKAIETSAPGLRIAEHLPMIAQRMKHLAAIRSMSTKEGDHGRASYLLRTGYLPSGPISHPTLGSLISKELERPEDDLPSFVSVAPFRFFNPQAFGPGFLGPRYAPFMVGEQIGYGAVPDAKSLKVEDLEAPRGIDRPREDDRLKLLELVGGEFHATHPDAPVTSHQLAYQKAVRLMRSAAGDAFNLELESEKTRDAYGRNSFGQGCLLARRLVERGVPFVEVTLAGVGNQALGWDTHLQNYTNTKRLCEVLDPAWAVLMDDLESRGLLDSTTIIWMGEFGRTPRLNPQGGRDHYPAAWSTVLGGGGIKGGQAFGDTGKDGVKVKDREVTVPDLIATVCKAIGIDPTKQNMSEVGRPIRIASPEAKPIAEVLS